MDEPSPSILDESATETRIAYEKLVWWVYFMNCFRAPLLVICLCSVLVTGCHNKEFKPIREAEVPDAYPSRSDWLVVSTPKGTPTQLPLPGFPPLSALDRDPPVTTGDDSLLWAEVKSRAILNPKQFKHLETDPRPFITKGLTMLFGTPAKPTVGVNAAQLDEMIANSEQNLKQPGLKADDKETIQDELKVLKAKRAGIEDQPKILSELGLEQEKLERGGVLFRDYCQQCHGLTGDGNGPGGKYLTPLPRDYRSGIFKFISTKPNPAGVKPSRADLYRTIRNGLDGSAMPSFAHLKPEQIDDLVSYVIHLSIRGETEFQLLKTAADPKKAEDYLPADTQFMMMDSVKKILAVWRESNSSPIEIVPDPYTTSEEHLAAAARGHKLFLDSSQGGCVQCHVNFGRGGPLQYDAWAGILRPRNLTLPTFRVSRNANDIYTRVYCGIPGVGMPSHADALKVTETDKEKGQNRMWDIVHFVQTISDPNLRRQLRERYGVNID
jgi:mono/diheme cytochrome c family protein